MRVVRGVGLAFGFFAASFALHVVGGATDQGWLFAIAVGLIYIAATGFPAIALWFAGLDVSGGGRETHLTLLTGSVLGLATTLGALWATNERAFAWWEFPLAPVLVALSSGAIIGIRGWRKRPAVTRRITKSD